MVDKFLAKLKTTRNDFITYITFLISMYLVIDRVVELLLLIFTGVGVSYWGPIQYTLAFAMPVISYIMGCSSDFLKGGYQRITYFYAYTTMLYIMVASMLTQWINQIAWIGFFNIPNFEYIVNNLDYLVKPAFTAISVFLPVMTFYPMLRWAIFKISDTRLIKESIELYKGIDLSAEKEETGAYTCENYFCRDRRKGTFVIVPENKRLEAALVVGASGSGKTSTVIEPMITRDFEKKYFLREASKEMGYNALKAGLATINVPYDNDYLNKNFRLDMLTPAIGKEAAYRAFMKKLIIGEEKDKIIYKGIGVLSMTPDIESTKRIIQYAKNYGLKVNLLDPLDATIGINPFAQKNPSTLAIVIANSIQAMYFSSRPNHDEAYMENVGQQALENLSLMLKEMYPKLHDGLLPTLEDVLNMLNNFDLVEEMCRKMEEDPELSVKYASQIVYFQRNFYRKVEGTNLGSGREETSKYVFGPTTQLDNLLRYPGVKAILCNRTNNINLDEMLAEGQVTLLCTRRGGIGSAASKALGLFTLLQLQQATLRRPTSMKNRVPMYVYIDEFNEFVNGKLEPLFTTFRKHRVGILVGVQNLAQLGGSSDKTRQVVLSNTKTKVVFGDGIGEDNKFWEDEFAVKRDWEWNETINMETNEYDSKKSGVTFKWKPNYRAGQIQAMPFKMCVYKTKDLKGKNVIGQGYTDFVDEKHKREHDIKVLNFDKFIIHHSTNDKGTASITEESDENFDPIKYNDTDSSIFFNNDGAASLKFGKK